MVDQLEECRLAPLDVIEDDDQPLHGAGSLQGLPKGPGDLLCRCRCCGASQQRIDRVRRGAPLREHVELVDHFDHRAVRDPLPVGQAATADNRRLDRRNGLGHQTGLADAGLADDGQALAAILRQHASPGMPDQRDLAHSSHESRVVPPARRIAHAQEPESRTALGLALQLEWLDRLHLGRVAYEVVRRRSQKHFAGLRRLLQPGRDIDRVAGRQTLSRSRHHLAGHDADPRL